MSILKFNKIADSGNTVPYLIAKDIIEEAKKGYYLDGNLLPSIEWTIDASWFYDNLFGWHHETWENFGFRLYPALKENRLCFVICRSTNYNPELEDLYFLIDPGSPDAKKIDSINQNEANLFISSFLIKVEVAEKVSGAEGYLRKSSRFYDWYLIRAYLVANGYNENPFEESNYSIKISLGLTDLESASALYKIYYKQIAEKPEDLLGFTTVIELIIGETPVAREGKPGDVSLINGIIEIGNPCPPRCLGSGLSF